MKKGSIAKCLGDFDGIDTNDYPKSITKEGKTLKRTLTVGETSQMDFAGNYFVEGTAARQDLEPRKVYDIESDGSIALSENRSIKTTHTAEFLCDGGEYVITENTKKTFVFDLIADAVDEVISDAAIDIDALIDANPDARYWMGGYYNRPGDVSSGDGYADGDIFDDDEFAEVFRESDMNRIGMEFEFESEVVKMLVTEGAYVHVYRPSDYDSLQFKRLIDEVIKPHLTT